MWVEPFRIFSQLRPLPIGHLGHCYVNAIYLTIANAKSLLSLFLSLWAGYRDSRKSASGGRI